MNTNGIEFFLIGLLSFTTSLTALIYLGKVLIEILKLEKAALIPVPIKSNVKKTPNSEAGFSIIQTQLETVCSFPIIQEKRYEAPMP